MSKALPVAVAIILGGAALIPVYYATQHPATNVGSKADQNASPVQKSAMRSVMKLPTKHLQSLMLMHLYKVFVMVMLIHLQPTHKSSFKPPILLISKKRSKRA